MEKHRKKKLEWTMKWIFNRKATETKLATTLLTTLDTLSRQFRWQPLLQFPFGRLPKELQLRIWELSRDKPRIIPLEARSRLVEQNDGSVRRYIDCVAVIKTPTILHICRDSREIGLKIYNVRFETFLRHPIYFDSKCEALAPRSAAAWGAFFNAGPTDTLQFDFGSIPFLVIDLRSPPGKREPIIAMPFSNNPYLKPNDRFFRIGMFEEVVLLTNKSEIKDAEGQFRELVSEVPEWAKRFTIYWQFRKDMLRNIGRNMPPCQWPTQVDLSLKQLRQRMADRL